MMKHWVYLIVDAGSLLVPLLFSFHPKIVFYKYWKAVLGAMLTVAIPFLLWDGWFTTRGIWGFSDEYLTGISIGNLPLEEVLFFLCIPFSCLFTWYSINLLYKKNTFESYEPSVSTAILLISAFIIFAYADRQYTLSSIGLLFLVLAVTRWKKGSYWTYSFYRAYTILLIPFFIVNGILTGAITARPVVWYNNNQNMGVRIISIPLEDFFYGMLLILCNVLAFEYFKGRQRLQLQQPVKK